MQEKRQNNSPIKQRILLFIEHLGISKRDFYSNTGISRGTLQNATDITEKTIVKFIRNYTNVNPVWLLIGDGDMLLSDTRSEPENWIDYKGCFTSVRYTCKDLLRVGVRIEEICHHYGITYEQLAEKTGLDCRMLTQIINGKRPAPERVLQKIEKLFSNLNSTWLYCGKGSMHSIDETYDRGDIDASDAVERDCEQHLTECIASKELEEQEMPIAQSEQEERLQKQAALHEKNNFHRLSQTEVRKPKKNT